MQKNAQERVDAVFGAKRFSVMFLVELMEGNEQSGGGGEKEGERAPSLVFIDYAYMVRWHIDPTTMASLDPELKKLIVRAANLNTQPCAMFSDIGRMTFKMKVAQIVTAVLNNDGDSAAEMCKEAQAYYGDRNVEVYRRRQIFYAMVIYLVLGIILHILYSYAPRFFANGFAAFLDDICQCCRCGATSSETIFYMLEASLAGSFFSVVKTASVKRLSASCGRKLQIADVAARSLIAVIVGALTLCVMKSNLLPPALGGLNSYDGSAEFSYIAIAFIAGLTDSYIPSLISTSIGANTKSSCVSESEAS